MANIIICLVHQMNYRLYPPIAGLCPQAVSEGQAKLWSAAQRAALTASR